MGDQPYLVRQYVGNRSKIDVGNSPNEKCGNSSTKRRIKTQNRVVQILKMQKLKKIIFYPNLLIYYYYNITGIIN